MVDVAVEKLLLLPFVIGVGVGGVALARNSDAARGLAWQAISTFLSLFGI
jgi:hypothetical protein